MKKFALLSFVFVVLMFRLSAQTSDNNLTQINQALEKVWKHNEPDQRHEEENIEEGGYQQYES